MDPRIMPTVNPAAPTAIPGAADTFADRAASFGESAGNSFLFGLPEWLTKKIIDPSILKKINEKARSKNKSQLFAPTKERKAGAVAGTIASALVPSPIKGAQVGASIAKAAPGLAKAAPFIGSAIVGGAEGALQSGARAFTSGAKPSEILKQSGAGALWGAGGGALGEGLGQLGKTFAKSKTLAGAVDSVADTTRGASIKSIAPGLNMRAVNKYMGFMSGKKAGMVKKVTEIDDAMSELNNFARTNDISTPYDVKQFAGEVLDDFHRADKAFEAVHGSKTGSQIIDMIADRPGFYESLDNIKGADPNKVMEAVSNMRASVGNSSNLPQLRGFIQEEIDSAFDLPNAADKRAIVGAGHAILDNISKVVGEAVDETGTVLKKPFATRLTEYKYIMPLSEGVVRSSTPKAFNLGSPTQIQTTGKEAILNQLAGRGATGAGLGGITAAATPGDAQDKLIAGLGGAALGMVGGPMIGRGVTKLMGKGSAIAEAAQAALPRLAESIPNISGATGRLAANMASPEQRGLIAPENMGRVMGGPGTVGQAQAAATGAEAGQAIASGDGQTYQDIIQAKLSDLWDTTGGEAQFPGRKGEFIAAMYSASGGFKPENTAGLLYPDPEERQKFLTALKFNSEIAQSLPEAGETGGGLFGTTLGVSGDEMLARNTAKSKLMGDLSEGLTTPNGITSKEIKTAVGKVLNSKGSIEKKREKLGIILNNYGINLDMLTKWGLA